MRVTQRDHEHCDNFVANDVIIVSPTLPSLDVWAGVQHFVLNSGPYIKTT